MAVAQLAALEARLTAHEQHCDERHENTEREHARLRDEIAALRETVSAGFSGIYARMWGLMISALGGTMIMAGVVVWALIRKGAGLP